MPAFLIDPAAKEVRSIEVEGEFLDVIRAQIGCLQVAVLPVSANRFAVWCDSMGMLKSGRAFWRFNDSDYRFAGRCVLTAVHPENGLPSNFPDSFTAEGLREAVVFHPSEDLVKIHEEVVIIQDDAGRNTPAIQRRAEWRQEIQPPPPLPLPTEDDIGSGWTIYEREDGTFRAVRYALKDDELRPVALITAANLDEIRGKLPPGLERIEADEREEGVVEHWMVPVPEEVG
jgi:hypothetical protein